MDDRITPAPGITDRPAPPRKLDCGVVAPDVRLPPDKPFDGSTLTAEQVLGAVLYALLLALAAACGLCS